MEQIDKEKLLKACESNADKVVDWGLKHPFWTAVILWLLIGKVGKSFRQVRHD